MNNASANRCCLSRRNVVKVQCRRSATSGGSAQIREREARAEEMRRDAAKPFARTADDVDIDRAFRERTRFGDPMAHLVARRQKDAPPLPVIPEHMRKLMRKSGFVVPQVREHLSCCVF